MREKKQKRSLIIAAAVFAVLLVVYLAVILPLMKDDTTATPPELLEGEALGPNNIIMMFPQVTRAYIKQIDVTNEHGEYTLVKDGPAKLGTKALSQSIATIWPSSRTMIFSGFRSPCARSDESNSHAILSKPAANAKNSSSVVAAQIASSIVRPST